MKTPEDEAFDELARKQGAWGGGFKAKQAMAADKQHWNEDEWRRNNWRCGHGWLRGEQCEICNAPQPAQEPWRESASDYERGVIDGRQMQAQSSVDKAVNAMTQRPWVGLMRGARVEGDTVVIKVQSNNEARLLCSALVSEVGKNI